MPQVIAAWASRYIPQEEAEVGEDRHDGVVAAEPGVGKFQNAITAGRHHLFADEPASVGGLDSGPSPYDYLAAALAACTAMTLRVYAEYKQLGLGRLTVSVRHGKLRPSTATIAVKQLVAGQVAGLLADQLEGAS